MLQRREWELRPGKSDKWDSTLTLKGFQAGKASDKYFLNLVKVSFCCLSVVYSFVVAFRFGYYGDLQLFKIKNIYLFLKKKKKKRKEEKKKRRKKEKKKNYFLVLLCIAVTVLIGIFGYC